MDIYAAHLTGATTAGKWVDQRGATNVVGRSQCKWPRSRTHLALEFIKLQAANSLLRPSNPTPNQPTTH